MKIFEITTLNKSVNSSEYWRTHTLTYIYLLQAVINWKFDLALVFTPHNFMIWLPLIKNLSHKQWKTTTALSAFGLLGFGGRKEEADEKNKDKSHLDEIMDAATTTTGSNGIPTPASGVRVQWNASISKILISAQFHTVKELELISPVIQRRNSNYQECISMEAQA